MNCIHDDINTTYMQSFMQSLNPTFNKTQNETCADLEGFDWVWKIHINSIHIHCNEISITRPRKQNYSSDPAPSPLEFFSGPVHDTYMRALFCMLYA